MCSYVQRRFEQEQLIALNTTEVFINIEGPTQDKIEEVFQNGSLVYYVNCRIWESNWNGVYAKKSYEDNFEKVKNIYDRYRNVLQKIWTLNQEGISFSSSKGRFFPLEIESLDNQYQEIVTLQNTRAENEKLWKQFKAQCDASKSTS